MATRWEGVVDIETLSEDVQSRKWRRGRRYFGNDRRNIMFPENAEFLAYMDDLVNEDS